MTETARSHPQLGWEDLTGMSPDEVNTAREAGRLDVLLGARTASEAAQRADVLAHSSGCSRLRT